MHINNSGLRTIGRVLGVSFQLVAYWIKTGTEKIKKVKEEMNRDKIYHYMDNDLPPIDILIRTGGEKRLSN